MQSDDFLIFFHKNNNIRRARDSYSLSDACRSTKDWLSELKQNNKKKSNIKSILSRSAVLPLSLSLVHIIIAPLLLVLSVFFSLSSINESTDCFYVTTTREAWRGLVWCEFYVIKISNINIHVRELYNVHKQRARIYVRGIKRAKLKCTA